MALNGSFTGTTANQYIQPKIVWSATQNVTGNYSNVTATLYYSRTNTGHTTEGTWNGSITINGTKTSGSKVLVLTYNSNTQALSATVKVPHNADGSKTITISAAGSIAYTTLSSTTISASVELNKIPRQATITAAPNFNDEGNPTITYSNTAGSAVTSLKACISLTGAADDIAYRDISKTGTSYTFNLTDAERKVLRAATNTANSRTVRFYVQTVIGGQTYLSYLAKTFSIINAAPTLAPTANDIDADMLLLTGDSNRIVKYYSNPQWAVNAAAKKEATIKSYKVTCGSNTSTAASGTFYNVDTNIIKFAVTDSRGNTAEKTLTKTLVSYVKPTCNLIASAPTTAGEMALTISGNYFNGSFGAVTNSLTVQYRYKTNDGEYGEWIAAAPTITNNTYKAQVAITGLDYLNSYTFQARAWEAVTIVESGEKTVKTNPVFDWGESDFNINGELGLNSKGVVLRRNGDNGNIVLSAQGDAKDGIFLRPNGTGSADGQLILKTDGVLESKRTDLPYTHMHGNSGLKVGFGIGGGGTNYGIYNLTNAHWLIHNDGTNTHIRSDGGKQFTYGVNKVLWSGVNYLNNNQTITFSDSAYNQPNGIVLVFGKYENGALTNSHFHSFFFSKYFISAKTGYGNCVFMSGVGMDPIGCKYMYVGPTSITGNAVNYQTGTKNGVTYNNQMYVICYVIGV